MANSDNKDELFDNLASAMTLLKNKKEVKSFLLDLCTVQEIAALSERWEIARLLEKEKLPYRSISAQTGASTATITRVGRFLNHERHHGYKTILDRL